jgi:hypothetical protein
LVKSGAWRDDCSIHLYRIETKGMQMKAIVKVTTQVTVLSLSVAALVGCGNPMSVSGQPSQSASSTTPEVRDVPTAPTPVDQVNNNPIIPPVNLPVVQESIKGCQPGIIPAAEGNYVGSDVYFHCISGVTATKFSANQGVTFTIKGITDLSWAGAGGPTDGKIHGLEYDSVSLINSASQADIENCISLFQQFASAQDVQTRANDIVLHVRWDESIRAPKCERVKSNPAVPFVNHTLSF